MPLPTPDELVRALRLVSDPSVRIVRQDVLPQGRGPAVTAMKHAFSADSIAGPASVHDELGTALDLCARHNLIRESWQEEPNPDLSWVPADVREHYESWTDAAHSGGDHPIDYVGSVEVEYDVRELLREIDESDGPQSGADLTSPPTASSRNATRDLVRRVLVARFWSARFAERAWELMWDRATLDEPLGPCEGFIEEAGEGDPSVEMLRRIVADVRARWDGATRYRLTLPKTYDGEEIDRFHRNPDRQSFTDYLQPGIDNLRDFARVVARGGSPSDPLSLRHPFIDGSRAEQVARSAIPAIRARLMEA